MDPMDRLSAQEEMDARIAKKSSSKNPNDNLVKRLKTLRHAVSKAEIAKKKAYANLKVSDTMKNESRYESASMALKEAMASHSEAIIEKEKRDKAAAEKAKAGVRPATGAKPMVLKQKDRVRKSLFKSAGGSRGPGSRSRSGMGAAVERWSQLFADDV